MDDPDWIIEVREWLRLCKQLADKRRARTTRPSRATDGGNPHTNGD